MLKRFQLSQNAHFYAILPLFDEQSLGHLSAGSKRPNVDSGNKRSGASTLLSLGKRCSLPISSGTKMLQRDKDGGLAKVRNPASCS